MNHNHTFFILDQANGIYWLRLVVSWHKITSNSDLCKKQFHRQDYFFSN
jgi:hypothetical protein